MTDSSPLSIVVLISGGGSNLQAIIDAVDAGRVNARIKAVISNRHDAYGLERARQHGIDSHVVDHTRYSGREDFEHGLQQAIEPYKPDLILMAGFMRVLSAWFITLHTGRLINIHPSLLPAFRGLHTHARALQAGVETHGCSVHFATPDLDSGPVILQASVPVYEDDSEETLATRVLEKEHIIYPLVTKWFCQRRLGLLNNSIQLDGEVLVKPLQLDKLNEELM